MKKRLATVVAAGALALGTTGLTAPTSLAATTPAVVKPAITCGTYQMELGSLRYSFYGNCADHAVNIHITLVIVPVGGGTPTTLDIGDQCVASQGVYEMGNMQVIVDAHYEGTETGAC